jgi:hypothetical protein
MRVRLSRQHAIVFASRPILLGQKLETSGGKLFLDYGFRYAVPAPVLRDSVHGRALG